MGNVKLVGATDNCANCGAPPSAFEAAAAGARRNPLAQHAAAEPPPEAGILRRKPAGEAQATGSATRAVPPKSVTAHFKRLTGTALLRRMSWASDNVMLLRP